MLPIRCACITIYVCKASISANKSFLYMKSVSTELRKKPSQEQRNNLNQARAVLNLPRLALSKKHPHGPPPQLPASCWPNLGIGRRQSVIELEDVVRVVLGLQAGEPGKLVSVDLLEALVARRVVDVDSQAVVA